MEKGLKLKQVLAVTDLPKSTFYYKSRKKDDLDLMDKIKNIAEDKTYYGYRRIHLKLLKDDIKVNHKKVYNIYCKMNLQKKITRKRKDHNIPKIQDYEPLPALYPNHIWGIDFMFITIAENKKVKILTVEDLFSRKAMLVYPDTSITSADVSYELEKVFYEYGQPEIIRSDNGAEFTSKLFAAFLNKHRIYHDRIPKGSPYFNGITERFNKTVKYELYFVEYIQNFKELNELTNNYALFYNNKRPHQALGNKSPDEVYYMEKSP